MASLMPQGKHRYTDNNGNNLSGGKLYAFAAGTSTPLATHSDQAGLVENTHPVILNARGEATIFWGSSPYKVVLKDASDVEIWTQDNLQASTGAADLASTASGKGASLVGFLQSGTGAVARTVQSKLRDFVSVKDFGAVGDGVANDTPAFQKIYDLGVSGKTIYCIVPSGTYLLSTSPSVGSGPVIFISMADAVFTGSGKLPFTDPAVNKGFRIGSGQPIDPNEGGVLRGDVALVRGDTSFGFFTKDYTGALTDTNDAVLFGAYAVDGTSTPRTWTQNINIVKKTTGSAIAQNYACGIEISVQNQTTVHGEPNNNECLQGLFVSYIGTGSGVNKGSAGLVVSGNGSTADQGWQYGLWIDNIISNGTGIRVGNISGAQTMASALDTRTHTGAFQGGAILLGNNHRIVGNDSGGGARQMLFIDTSNFLQVGDLGITGGTVINTQGFLLPNIVSSATANAGAAALPANPVGFITVSIAGTDRKIPYYAI